MCDQLESPSCLDLHVVPAKATRKRGEGAHHRLRDTKAVLVLPLPVLTGRGSGEGLSPRARFVESPPHPNPPRASFARLGPASGERERTVVMAVPPNHIMLLADLIRRR